MKRCLILLFTFLVACGPNGEGDNQASENHEDNSEDHESPAEDACEHAEEGPILAVSGSSSADDAPDVSEFHTRYDLTLPGEPPEGYFSFESDAEMEVHLFYFHPPVEVTVTDASGDVVESEGALADLSACSTLAGGEVFDLGVGTYTVMITGTDDDATLVWIRGDDEGHE